METQTYCSSGVSLNPHRIRTVVHEPEAESFSKPPRLASIGLTCISVPLPNSIIRSSLSLVPDRSHLQSGHIALARPDCCDGGLGTNRLATPSAANVWRREQEFRSSSEESNISSLDVNVAGTLSCSDALSSGGTCVQAIQCFQILSTYAAGSHFQKSLLYVLLTPSG